MNNTYAITPAARFAAMDLQNAAPIGSPVYKAIAAARYWESFPDSYTADQVEAGRALIGQIGQGTATAETIARVLALR
jgi:hypothetical protein